jgi:hypothetical protein
MRLALLAFLVGVSLASWDTLCSPSDNKVFLKLTTEEIIQLDRNGRMASGDSVGEVISSPTAGEYALALANGDLYAFFGDRTAPLSVSKLSGTNWTSVEYSTTLQNDTHFFNACTLMTSYDEDSGKEMVYSYGGRLNDTVTNRLLEFNPIQNTLNSIITSISPTAFYGASNTVLDKESKANILIGGKASSGWVSMFQVALWEYKSWTFKTVKEASFNVNSRVNPLLLSVFGDDDSVDSVLVIGGSLADSMASPYVMSLNLTDNWRWQNITGIGDFQIDDCLGAVVIGDVLISITSSGKKGDSSYQLNLFELGNMKSVDTFQYTPSSMASSLSSSKLSSSSSSASLSSSKLSSSSSSASLSSSNSVSSILSLGSSAITYPSSSQIPSASSTSFSTPESSLVPLKRSHSSTITIAVVVPVLSIVLIGILCWFMYKKFTNNNEITSNSDSDSEYYKAISIFDTASISSWALRRDEYQRHIEGSPSKSLPKSSAEKVEESPLKKLKSIYMPPRHNRMSGPFAEPEDYEDRQELSPMTHSNKPRVSLTSTQRTLDSSDEKKIDEFFQERDVQVLVSTKRRSILRIMNPDLESLQGSDDIVSQASESTSDTMFFNEKELQLGEGFHFDVQSILKKLDGDDL